MDDMADGTTRRLLTVRLEVDLDGQPVTGRLVGAEGAEERFVGWLGFVDALRTVQQRVARGEVR